MVEEQKPRPEAMRVGESQFDASSVRTHLGEVLARGPIVFADPRHGGVHGTSWEAVEHIIKTGRLPGRTIGDSSTLPPGLDYTRGDLNFFPTEQLLDTAQEMRDQAIVEKIKHPVQSDGNSTRSTIREAKQYAAIRAGDHYFLNELGFSLDDEAATSAARMAMLDDEYAFFLDRGISQERIVAVMGQAQTRKGVLLAFDPEISTLHLMPGDPGEGDMRVRPGEEGLDYRFISGMQPLGYQEGQLLRESLENLREQETQRQTDHATLVFGREASTVQSEQPSIGSVVFEGEALDRDGGYDEPDGLEL